MERSDYFPEFHDRINDEEKKNETVTCPSPLHRKSLRRSITRAASVGPELECLAHPNQGPINADLYLLPLHS